MSSHSPNTSCSPLPLQRVSILAVVVVYQIPVEQCISLRNLLRSQTRAADPELELTLLVVDNSPESQPLDHELPSNVHILHVPENLGLANAYNRSIRLAECRGITWLLTLDQDTELPATFLADIAAHARNYQNDPSIAAILPHVLSDSASLSPYFSRWHALPTWFARGYFGIPDQPIFAINSTSLIRVDALAQAGGYDPLFWLDSSDMAIFSRLSRLGKRVVVAGDIEVQHELSVKDMQHRLSPLRYRHMLLAESAFWDAEMGLLAGLERTARLSLRLLRQVRRHEDAALRALTFQALLRRLFRSARHRRRLFREDVEQRLGSHLAKTALPPRRAKVSVCMASYNSGHYIDLQLASILPQLDAKDEVIIIDDNSNDGTPDRIRALGDPRIRLIEHTQNIGFIRSFEHALRSATGDLLFLSDHDDLWAPNKIQIFREAFAKDWRTQVVMSAVSLINSEGIPFGDKRWDRDGQFQRGFFRNIVKNGYQGSALALRSDLLAYVLPFPATRTYFHDVWIGTVNDRLGGGMAFLPQPLLLYRRHRANISQSMSPWQRLLSRTQLLWDHLRCGFTGRHQARFLRSRTEYRSHSEGIDESGAPL